MPKFRTVIFDCDSTLSAIEGIDELAVDCREDVERLTDAAMRGRIPLEEVSEGYHIFNNKLDGCIKPVLIPPRARH